MVIALYTPASAVSDATKVNNGAKLMLKEGTDSLFCTYEDPSDYVGVMFGYSEGGESWLWDIVVTGRDYPAIAADSTGKRWIAAHKAYVGQTPEAEELYYFSGGMWNAVTLYSVGALVSLGPPSIAGAAFSTTSIVYVAFLVTNQQKDSNYVVLTKFNGTTVAVCTVRAGTDFGDPAVAVEPYSADSNRIHITWEDDGIIQHALGLDCRTSSSIAPIAVGPSIASGTHPSINAHRDWVVVAWAQGSPPEIYARQRVSGTWQDAANQSDTPNDSSDYATIALGDAVVVAWEETNSASDHDIIGHVDFDHDITIHDSDTISSYPHIVLLPDGSVYAIWSEPDSVGYTEYDLNEGEGQQSASSGSLLTEPSLAACLPNPFHSHTQISYALPAASDITLQVYDATGRPVRTLASGHQTAGNYSVSWDARDTKGKQVPYGVYFYRLDTPGFRSVKKAIVTK